MMRIKEELPNTCIIAGGTHASGIADSLLRRAPWLDIVVIGEGEIPLTQILYAGSNIGAEAKWAKIPNLMFKRRSGPKTGEIITTEQKPLEFDMTDIKSYYPEHNLEFHGNITLEDSFCFSTKKSINIPLETSRGCPYNCNFCMVPWVFKRKYRLRSVKAVIRDIKEMDAKFGQEATGKPVRFLMYDANFGMNPTWRAEWLQALNKLGKKIEWECETRLDKIDSKVMARYSEAGLIQSFVGIESGSERVRKEILNKNFFLDRLLDTIKKTKDLVHFLAGYIIGAPSETLEEIEETVMLASKLSQESGLNPPNHDHIAWSFKLYPKTYLTEHIDEYIKRGTKLLVDMEWWMDPNTISFFSKHIEPSPGVTPSILEEMFNKFYEGVYGSDYREEGRLRYENFLTEIIRTNAKKYLKRISKAYPLY